MNDLAFSRRRFLKTGVYSLAGLAAAGTPLGHLAATEGGYPEFDQTIVLDMLTGIHDSNEMFLEEPVERSRYEFSPRGLSDLLNAGVTMINHTLPYVFGEGDPFEVTIAAIARMDETIRHHPNQAIKVLARRDILEAKRTGRLGVLYGFQNCTQFGETTERVDTFIDLGVRCFQLTYNDQNQLGSGSIVPNDTGLTEFGRACVARLNERHQLIDMSHSGQQTCLDTIAASTGPIAITHTGCRALADLPRNKTDQELRLMADKGGVAGIYWMPFLSTTHQPMADDLIQHIEHAINICGEDHVGIGTDIGPTKIDDLDAYAEYMAKQHEMRSAAGIAAPGESEDSRLFLPDMTGVNQYRELADRLYKRGHSTTRIKKILGANFMRLLGDIWD